MDLVYQGNVVTANKLNEKQIELQRTEKQTINIIELENQIMATEKYLSELKILLDCFQ